MFRAGAEVWQKCKIIFTAFLIISEYSNFSLNFKDFLLSNKIFHAGFVFKRLKICILA